MIHYLFYVADDLPTKLQMYRNLTNVIIYISPKQHGILYKVSLSTNDSLTEVSFPIILPGNVSILSFFFCYGPDENTTNRIFTLGMSCYNFKSVVKCGAYNFLPLPATRVVPIKLL